MGYHLNEAGEFELDRNLLNIYDFYRAKRLRFSGEIIARYFLSLQTKPFVILTGISGTGKTKIAQIFADFILQEASAQEQEARRKFIPVRPDWMDNRGLLGFYNLLDEKYHATPLLQLLLTAQEPTIKGKPCFVILDEMNLARVEQYFSDFLSIMESRTSDNPEGETIQLHAFETPRETVGGLVVPNRLGIPSNVFFTGTVNVDESTYMFSPKVLDRSNVIEFNEVELEPSKAIASERFVLRDEQQVLQEIGQELASWRLPSIQDYERAARANPSLKGVLRNLLNLLKPYHLHFGYRVINEISRFLLNAERAVANYTFEDAFDIQILQKILPKFHGTQAKLQGPLESFLAFCFSDQKTYDDTLMNQAAEHNSSARFPRSARKIANMLRNLQMQGYCSFIE
ncbi:AAA domain (dynein-related subfamily) [Desulfacinum hydrothermale DSM 13146]|uniref:AAA domain (Dynein-related subfamily) n=1 Tax=Desulfacinum hydrothermale DSM 13146 TaxID=1121390 RepID=A0A1W1XRX6_9BACT|nr:AAA family ATPase [Desulfacinum hydrothermale]SMC26646.1 AAA domain (dynein-related subfamily) [Desulfacinum hydrothermale DSM 13146]